MNVLGLISQLVIIETLRLTDLRERYGCTRIYTLQELLIDMDAP